MLVPDEIITACVGPVFSEPQSLKQTDASAAFSFMSSTWWCEVKEWFSDVLLVASWITKGICLGSVISSDWLIVTIDSLTLISSNLYMVMLASSYNKKEKMTLNYQCYIVMLTVFLSIIKISHYMVFNSLLRKYLLHNLCINIYIFLCSAINMAN